MGNNFGRIDVKRHRCEVFNVEKINNLSILYETATFPPVFSQIMDVKSDTLPSLKHIAKTILRGCKGQKICYNSDIYHHNYNGEFMKKIFGFTHSENAAHVDTSNKKRKAAFTLAEVLITLGIIGVVAAMTMPSVINDYKKQETASKLSHTYSLLSQALVMAQAEHGDQSTWKLGFTYGASTTTGSEEDILDEFLNTYLFPYIKIIKNYGYINGSDSSLKVGYNGPYKPLSKQSAGLNHGYYFILADGTLINAFVGNDCKTTDADGNCTERVFAYITFGVDINGTKGTNIMGKEYFLMFYNNSRMLMYGVNPNFDRETIKNNCASDTALSCGGLIQRDGWKVREDYPWF